MKQAVNQTRCASPVTPGDFRYIAEMSTEEKTELLAMWEEYKNAGN